MLGLGFIAKNLSIKSRNMLGVIIGDLLRILSSKRSDITYHNIRMAFPEYNEEKCDSIRNDSYRNLGITLIELLVFKSLDRNEFLNYVKFENIELVTKKIAEGRGLIFLSGHFGNWELTAYVIGLIVKVPITIIVKPQRNKLSDEYLNELRTNGGNKIVPMGKAARTIINTIRNNEAIALLVDQSADPSKDAFVPFFGMPAATYEAPAALALKYRTPIILGFAHRQDDCTYKAVIEELDFSDLDDSKDSILELTRRHVKILEDNIRKSPGHWAWQHKRWKHTPPSEL